MTRPQFILRFYGDAKRATRGTRLFPETLIVQAILESLKNARLSDLARLYNNFHGIKANPAWMGPVVSMTTSEVINGKRIRVTGTNKLYRNRQAAILDRAQPMSLFRAFATPADGFRGWVEFLQRNPRYSNVFTAGNPVMQFISLQRAGFATDPNYSRLLASIYNANRQTFDRAKAFFTQVPAELAGILPVVFFCL